MTATRTYGVYDFMPGAGRARGKWGLRLEPAVAVRAKRVFTRVNHDQEGTLLISDGDDVGRGIRPESTPS